MTNQVQQIFDSFALEGKITEKHAEEIKRIMRESVHVDYEPCKCYNKGYEDGLAECDRPSKYALVPEQG